MDLNAIGALLTGLEASASSTKVLVSTSGIACVPPGRVGTERDAGRTSAFGALRVASERLTLAGVQRGVRTAVMRLPPSVHGAGDKGFATWFLNAAREKGVSAYVGSGDSRWSAVHRDDAAVLYRLAVEGLASGAVPSGSVLHGVADVAVPFRDVAAAIADRLGLSPPQPAPRGHFSFFLRTVAQLDVPATSEITQKLVGWRPTRPGLLEDVRTSYNTLG
jgi:nucleoside-diphosphate-sugar epimerase